MDRIDKSRLWVAILTIFQYRKNLESLAYLSDDYYIRWKSTKPYLYVLLDKNTNRSVHYVSNWSKVYTNITF